MAAGHQFQQRERFITELPFGVLNKVHNTLDLGQGWLKLGLYVVVTVQYCIIEPELNRIKLNTNFQKITRKKRVQK